jgi:hypothetical protein
MMWDQYGVVLTDGTVCPAASETVARHHGFDPGHPVVCRIVTSTARGHSGDADVDIGPWEAVR